MPLQEMLKHWATRFSTIHVILGSVLDNNKDGERDSDTNYTWRLGRAGGVAIPSHFYGVFVRCKSGGGVEPADCELDQLDAVGLLFQHPTEAGVI